MDYYAESKFTKNFMHKSMNKRVSYYCDGQNVFNTLNTGVVSGVSVDVGGMLLEVFKSC